MKKFLNLTTNPKLAFNKYYFTNLPKSFNLQKHIYLRIVEMIKIFSLKTIGLTLVGISILYPLGVLLDTGESLNYILIGGGQNYELLRDISFILGIVLIIVSFFKKKSKKLIKRATEEEKIRVYADKINTKTRSKRK